MKEKITVWERRTTIAERIDNWGFLIDDSLQQPLRRGGTALVLLDFGRGFYIMFTDIVQKWGNFHTAQPISHFILHL